MPTPLQGNLPPFCTYPLPSPLQVITVTNQNSAPFHVPCKNGPHTPKPLPKFAPFNFNTSPCHPLPEHPSFKHPCPQNSHSNQKTLPSNLPAIYLAIPIHFSHPPLLRNQTLFYICDVLVCFSLHCISEAAAAAEAQGRPEPWHARAWRAQVPARTLARPS